MLNFKNLIAAALPALLAQTSVAQDVIIDPSDPEYDPQQHNVLPPVLYLDKHDVCALSESPGHCYAEYDENPLVTFYKNVIVYDKIGKCEWLPQTATSVGIACTYEPDDEGDYSRRGYVCYDEGKLCRKVDSRGMPTGPVYVNPSLYYGPDDEFEDFLRRHSARVDWVQRTNEVDTYCDGDDRYSKSSKYGSGTEVRNSNIYIDPIDQSVPRIAIPIAGTGATGFDADDNFFHVYNVYTDFVRRPNVNDFNSALANNPVPYDNLGNRSPVRATPEGIKNGVEVGPTYNIVTSYLIPSPNPSKYTDIVVNYTVEHAHRLHEGFVIRYGLVHAGHVIGMRSYGEGANFLQAGSTANLWCGNVEEVWTNSAKDIYTNTQRDVDPSPQPRVE